MARASGKFTSVLDGAFALRFATTKSTFASIIVIITAVVAKASVATIIVIGASVGPPRLKGLIELVVILYVVNRLWMGKYKRSIADGITISLPVSCASLRLRLGLCIFLLRECEAPPFDYSIWYGRNCTIGATPCSLIRDASGLSLPLKFAKITDVSLLLLS